MPGRRGNSRAEGQGGGHAEEQVPRCCGAVAINLDTPSGGLVFEVSLKSLKIRTRYDISDESFKLTVATVLSYICFETVLHRTKNGCNRIYSVARGG